jgi:hypothetical protein
MTMKNALSLHRLLLERRTVHEIVRLPSLISGADEVVYTATGEVRTALGIRTLDLFALCPAKPVPIGRSPRQVPRNRPEQ